jgi:predicted negative regulator of RcsB-dependent stress response
VRLAKRPLTPPPTRSGAQILQEARERWDNDDIDGALVLARAAADRGAGAAAHVLIGALLLKKQKGSEAENEFEEALRLDPSNRKATRLLQLTRGGRAEAD